MHLDRGGERTVRVRRFIFVFRVIHRWWIWRAPRYGGKYWFFFQIFFIPKFENLTIWKYFLIAIFVKNRHFLKIFSKFQNYFGNIFKLDISLQGRKRRSVSAFPVLRFRSSSPSEATTWTWRHSLGHSFCAHPHTADTIIAIGHVFVNLAQKVRQNLVPKSVPNRPVLKLNLTFDFFLEPSKSSFQSVSRDKHVSWVHILSRRNNYPPWHTHTHRLTHTQTLEFWSNVRRSASRKNTFIFFLEKRNHQIILEISKKKIFSEKIQHFEGHVRSDNDIKMYNFPAPLYIFRVNRM